MTRRASGSRRLSLSATRESERRVRLRPYHHHRPSRLTSSSLLHRWDFLIVTSSSRLPHRDFLVTSYRDFLIVISYCDFLIATSSSL